MIRGASVGLYGAYGPLRDLMTSRPT